MQRLIPAATGVFLLTFCQPLQCQPDERWRQTLEMVQGRHESGHYAEAERILLDLIRELEQEGSRDLSLAASLHEAGRVQLLLGKHREAEHNLQRAIRIYEEFGRTDGPGFVLALTDLSTLYDGCGQHGRANRFQKRAMDICDRSALDRAPECLRAVHDHAISLMLQRKYDQAERTFRLVLEKLDDGSAQSASIAYTTHFHLALLLQRAGAMQEADRHSRVSIELVEGLWGTDHPLTVQPHLIRASIEVSLGQMAEAENRYRRTLRIVESTLGSDRALYGLALREYAASLRKLKRKDEARNLERTAKSILDSSGYLRVQRGVVDISDLR